MNLSPRAMAVKFLRRAIASTGGVLLSGREHAELLAQRARAVSELTKREEGLGSGLSCFVVSCDRAIQLYALLETYFKFVSNPAPLTVIYRSSDDRHEKAYREVAAAFAGAPAGLALVRERGGFRETLITELARVKTRNLLFLTDDNLFLRPIDLRFAAEVDPLRSILSLRHSPHLRRSYTAGVEQSPPAFFPVESHPELLKFRWFEQGNEWSYPWSVDGHVLSTAEVSVLTRISDFKAPNTYEAALTSFNDLARDREGLCYRESVIVNLPLNRVQNEVENRCGGISADFLLDRWNEGLALDAGKFEGLVPQSTHEEHPVVFKERHAPQPRAMTASARAFGDVGGPIARPAPLLNLKRFNFGYFAHAINLIIAGAILTTGGGERFGPAALRAAYCFSLSFAGAVLWRHRGNALFLARTFLLILPGYYAAAVQLYDPNLYYSTYERVSQTLDISMTMFALSNLALLGSQAGLWAARLKTVKVARNPLSHEFFFYAPLVPLLLVSYYITRMYGETLFTASYASGTGMVGGMGSAPAFGAVLAFIMFRHYLSRPKLIKAVILAACLLFLLVYAQLVRGGRQDMLSCLFGLYVLYWGYKGTGAPISPAVCLGAGVGIVFMEYFGFIRGNVLASGFDYVRNFFEFLNVYLRPKETVLLGTISPITTTFANMVYALKTGITEHIWGKSYFEYLLRTPPEFLYPDRPRDYAWIFVDWNLLAGGGFFELAEAYFNFGALGVLVMPFLVSFFIARSFYLYVYERSMLSCFLLFGILSIFLRGALYQTFAYYRAETVALLLMASFWVLYHLSIGARRSGPPAQ